MFTQTIPLLFAGGACCAALAFGAAAGALSAAGVGAAAGLLAAAGAVGLLAAGAAAGLLAGAALAAGVEAVALSAAAVFLDLLFLVGVAASALAAGLDEASAVAALLAVVLSFASADLLFLVELFLAVVAASLGAAAPALSAVFAFDLLLDLVDFEASAVPPVLLDAASVLAVFFLVFFLVEVEVSVWSVEVDPACCAARVAVLPQISNSAANNDRNTPLLRLIVFPPSAAVRLASSCGPSTLLLGAWVGLDSGMLRGLS